MGVALSWLTVPTVAQSDPPPIWKGVFSEAEAERGKAAANQVNTVSDRDTLDALAFVLQLNGFPAGSDVSEDAAALGALTILPREGVRPMRTGMAAEVVG